MQAIVHSVEQVKAEALVGIPENPPVLRISAEGWTPTSGWSRPALLPYMYIDIPKDGVLDLSFVAEAPEGIVLKVLSKISVTETMPVPYWVMGVRVHAATNVAEALLSMKARSEPTGGDATPWPWWVSRPARATN